MNETLTHEQDISCGIKAYGIGSFVSNEEYDEDTMTDLMQNAHLKKDEIAIISKISFEIWPNNISYRYDISVFYEVRKIKTNYKYHEGIINITALDNPKDADIFLRMATKALSERKRPIIVDYKYEDLLKK